MKYLFLFLLAFTANAQEQTTPSPQPQQEEASDEMVCSYSVLPTGCRMCCESEGIKACRLLPQRSCPKKMIQNYEAQQ